MQQPNLPQDTQIIVRTVKVTEAGEVSNQPPKAFSQVDHEIADVINRVVLSVQNNVTIADPPSADGLPALRIQEIELSFGIDLANETHVAIIGPLLGSTVKAGATFQVKLTLSRKNS